MVLRLTPIMAVGFLVLYIAGMAAGQTHAMVIYSGIVAGWFFTLCLAMTPLYIIWNVRSGQKFKKPFGLLAFVYTMLHGFAYLVDENYDLAALTRNPSIVNAVLATLIMLPLALTSTPGAMRRMGKNWKRLQRMTYLAAILIVLHSRIFGLVLLILLMVRLPPVRHYLIQRRSKSTHKEPAYP
jgi:sulfoxide reductase heme-binding subunit YedZ